MINDQLTIESTGLGKRFNREWIFKNLSYAFHAGKTYAIIGPNGSGKSTLLQVLWGQLPQSAGAITFSSSGKNIPVEEVYNQVVVAAPYMDLIEELTLEEQLRFHFNMRKPRPGHSIEDMIARLYMVDSRAKQITNFSSGMKQRLKLGLAFFTEAKAIFLDEPGTNLDEQAMAWYADNLNNSALHGSLILIASNQKTEYPATAEVISVASFK